MDDPHRSFDTRRHLAVACVLALAGAAGACELDGLSNGDDAAAGVFYALGDDHHLYRWDPDADDGAASSDDEVPGTIESVLDLSGVWDARGDVGTVLRASLSVAPDQRHAAWISGATSDSSLMFGDLETGESTAAVAYPVDHACIDPVWLPDGSAVLVHRAAVWGSGDPAADAHQLPLPVASWGPLEWHSPEVGQLPSTVELAPQGCRMRWYTAEDGSAQAIYHNLDLTEFYRVDASGEVLEIIPTTSLDGAEPSTIGLIDVDPTGRHLCIVDGYGPHGAVKGGFTARAESGTHVIDLTTGAAVGPGEVDCTTLHDDGFISRDGPDAAFIDYDGVRRWSIELPAVIAESPVLYYFPDEA